MNEKKIPFDPASDGAQMTFDGRMAYGNYLALDKLLNAQKPLSKAHDEMLFIIQHQTTELWMKLAIHELHEVKKRMGTDDLAPAFKLLARVIRIFDQLNQAWQVLRTMTPSDYTTFREDLGQASGFQSYQYRAIEYLAGNKNAAMLRPHEHLPEVHRRLKVLLNETSLYDEAIKLLSRNGFAIDDDVLNRDFSGPYVPNDSVQNAWIAVYQDPEKYWSLYNLAEKLIDFEDYFRRWRFNHVTTVERIIGSKRGTGGTSGVPYLRRMLDVVLFPELWSLRGSL